MTSYTKEFHWLMLWAKFPKNRNKRFLSISMAYGCKHGMSGRLRTHTPIPKSKGGHQDLEDCKSHTTTPWPSEADIKTSNAQYKDNADTQRKRVFAVGDKFMVHLWKEHFPMGTYNKLKVRNFFFLFSFIGKMTWICHVKVALGSTLLHHGLLPRQGKLGYAKYWSTYEVEYLLDWTYLWHLMSVIYLSIMSE